MLVLVVEDIAVMKLFAITMVFAEMWSGMLPLKCYQYLGNGCLED